MDRALAPGQAVWSKEGRDAGLGMCATGGGEPANDCGFATWLEHPLLPRALGSASVVAATGNWRRSPFNFRSQAEKCRSQTINCYCTDDHSGCGIESMRTVRPNSSNGSNQFSLSAT